MALQSQGPRLFKDAALGMRFNWPFCGVPFARTQSNNQRIAVSALDIKRLMPRLAEVQCYLCTAFSLIPYREHGTELGAAKALDYSAKLSIRSNRNL
jgi:hypothetical protein